MDTGISLVLPPKPKPNEQPPKIKERNLLNIFLNANNQVLIEDTPTPIGQIKRKVERFINNKGQSPALSVSPQDAWVSIKMSRQATYSTYINMLDEVVGAYKDLRNAASMKRYGKAYDELKDGSVEQKIIQKLYPKQISIANPADSS